MFETNPQLQKASFDQVTLALMKSENQRRMLEKTSHRELFLIAILYKKFKSQRSRPHQQFYIGSVFE